MKREIQLKPAYDKRDPNPSKNYGVCSVTMVMVLSGKLGAVQFGLLTRWYLSHVAAEFTADNYHPGPLPTGLSYHSPVPTYEGHEQDVAECEHLGGKPCYSGRYYRRADDIFAALLTKGDAGAWQALEEFYVEMFERLE